MQWNLALEHEYNKIMESLSKQAKDTLEAFCNKIDAMIAKESATYFCPNHTFEIYLYEYRRNPNEYELCEKKFPEIYRKLAKLLLDEGNDEDAKEVYMKALAFNPIDLDTLFDLVVLYRLMGEWDAMKEVIDQTYDLCYSRSDISRYYRYLGCYYLETYQPELAKHLYEYSNLLYHSQQADDELKFLHSVLKDNQKKSTIAEIQNNLREHSIALQPDQKTLALLYQVAKQELSRENLSYARILFLFLYELTQDEEIKQIIQTIGGLN